jgi:pimeloyl-ACP methyl ester carboxylesterase
MFPIVKRRTLPLRAIFPVQVRNESAYILDRDNIKRIVHYFDSGNIAKDLLPPVLLLSGTSQTISTWQPHIAEITRTRRLIIPELRCTGNKTTLLPQFDSLYDFTDDIENFVNAIGVEKVDIVGFSLGARIGLAVAAHRPHLVRRLSVTGVPLERTAVGDLILMSWRNGLTSECCFKTTAWSFVLNGFSPQFLKRNSRYIPHYVDRVISNNDYKRLAYILSNSHSPDDKAAAINCAHMVTCPTQVIAATADRISDLEQEKRLAEVIQDSHFFEIKDAGHLSPFEEPYMWREFVINFLAHK